MAEIDIVTVYHRDENKAQADALAAALDTKYGDRINFIGVDNRNDNRGFARGCNEGARQGKAWVIGFLNPSVEILGDFVEPVLYTLDDDTVITGNRFGKRGAEIIQWGCKDWVCGATFFVTREFFEGRGGFDERFVMYFEETDLIRQAQRSGRQVRSQDLPLFHESPSEEHPDDVAYKQRWFAKSSARFRDKWLRVP